MQNRLKLVDGRTSRTVSGEPVESMNAVSVSSCLEVCCEFKEPALEGK